ncbi:tumor necrosis factor receptor superfamily member 13C [Trichechus manatus latirostris]|uniref:Tumor necrosis factor receptor superfamily member 13C n=1 Tax=Trichechus manatus latirostris TaxID=127582 RepID=A0A2Y9R6Z2_TRIMA|nr:tumor necrosis factor receptor superfamily member 13C [Trichechus manatus latirostris]
MAAGLREPLRPPAVGSSRAHPGELTSSGNPGPSVLAPNLTAKEQPFLARRGSVAWRLVSSTPQQADEQPACDEGRGTQATEGKWNSSATSPTGLGRASDVRGTGPDRWRSGLAALGHPLPGTGSLLLDAHKPQPASAQGLAGGLNEVVYGKLDLARLGVRTRSLHCARQPSVIELGARSMGGRDGPEPTLCGQAECFDRLLRLCVACNLFRTPEPSPAASASSPATGTALQPQESVGAGAFPQGALPLPALLFGAPALLALALALGLVGLLSWRRRRRGAVPLEAPDRDRNGTPDNVIILSPGPIDATTPVWSPPEDPATTPPGHSVPVPATELGSTELVTTKTAGPEQL